MLKRNSQSSSFDALDGVVALTIVVVWLTPTRFSFDTAISFFSTQIRIADAVYGLCFIFLWRYCFSILKLYDNYAKISSRIVATLQGVSIMILPVLAYCRWLHPIILSSRAVALTLLLLFGYEINRVSIGLYLVRRMAARDPRRAVIIGSGRRAGKAWRAIRTRYSSSMTLLGFIDDRDSEQMAPDVARRYLGDLDSLGQIILSNVVDLILIAMPIQSCYPLMQKAINIAESAGVQVIYLDDIYSTRRKNYDPNQSIFRELAPDQEHYLTFLTVKRLVDIIGSSVGLVMLSPLLLFIALAVGFTSKGPILFRQERYGHRRRRFDMYKFRSMVDDAEKLLPSLEHRNEAAGPIFKMADDPRITALGKIIRKTSLDELPQLWNVFLGDMSLVGPRPMSVRDVSLFDEAALMRRFSVKPGMTGLWQISGRSGTGFDHWVVMDNSYIDRWSLALDFKILARTIGAVIRRSGAM